MCGRYHIKDTDVLSEEMRALFNIPDWVHDQNAPRFNIAPSQDCPVLTMDEEGDVVVPSSMRWGFVPFWNKEVRPKVAPINAKSEGIATNAMFRQSVQKRRCLVPATGFYEWLRLDEKTKYAFDIHRKGGRPFVMAGIYEKATEVRPATFALLTTRPNELMNRIHDRMPVILPVEQAKEWLRPGPITPERVAELSTPYDAADMEVIPISQLVNSPKNDVPEVLTPVAFELPAKREKQEQTELF